MADLWAQMQNPVVYAIPAFLLFIAAEAFALRDEGGSRAGGYDAADTRVSVISGAASLGFMFVFKLATLVLFTVIWVELAPWHLPSDSPWTWLALMILVDATWYLNHRFSHRVRIGWAGHKAHHSSRYFNLGTALRLKWNPWSEAIFWIPLPLLGFNPWTIYVAYGVNMIYQFFLHTEVVGRLPRPIEFVFNTPAHHRIHHSRQPEHLDKNYGGILIIWDRMLGTFAEGPRRPVYGVADRSAGDDAGIIELQYGEYRRMIDDVRSTRIWIDRIAYVLGPPGWRPFHGGIRQAFIAETESARAVEPNAH